jgi:bacterioferritin-associated ferredoxin
MIVCSCKGVRCSSVRAVISHGAETVEAVGHACGAGTDCGSCRGMIEDMIEEHLEAAETHLDARGRTHLSVRQSAA